MEKAIRLDPAQRYASADEFADALLDSRLGARPGRCARGGRAGDGHWYHGPSTRSQQAFRWTALVVCLMMVAPGRVLRACRHERELAQQQHAELSDGVLPTGCPVRWRRRPVSGAQIQSLCRDQSEVDIQVVPDASQAVGFLAEQRDSSAPAQC